MFRHPLAREIAWLLAAKALALFALYSLFFSPAHRLEVTPEKVEQALLVSPAAATREGARVDD